LAYRGEKLAAPTPFLDFGADRIRHGMSGAPVLDLVTGQVVAMLAITKSETIPDGGLGIPWAELQSRLPDVSVANNEYHRRDRTWLAAVTEDTALPTMRHRSSVFGLDFDVGGARLASCSADRTARLWDSRTGEELACFMHPGLNLPRVNRPRIYDVALSPDGELLATASIDARLWSMKTCRELGRVRHHVTGLRSEVYYFMTKVAFSFSPAGRFLATATAESARVWSLDTKEEQLNVKHRFGNALVLRNVKLAPYSVALSREELRLAVARGPILSVWDVETREEIFRTRLSSSLNWFTTVAISLNGRYVLTGGATIALWDGYSGELLTQAHTDSPVTSIACTPAAEYAMYAEQNGAVRVLSTANWSELGRWQYSPVPLVANLFNGHAGPYGVASPCVAIDSLGRLAAIGGGDGTVRVINLLSMLS
jgi:WD40 repeat protein